MTVIDTSVAVARLLSGDELPSDDMDPAAPDVIVFEVLAVLRRMALRGDIDGERGAAALARFANLRLAIFPSLSLMERAWTLRQNLSAADALFVALAEALDEPLATRDTSLARAAAALGVAVA